MACPSCGNLEDLRVRDRTDGSLDYKCKACSSVGILDPEPIAAVLRMEGWAGREHVRCQIVGYTPQRTRIKLLQDCTLPGGRRHVAGDVVLVPTYAVKREDADNASS